MDKVTIQELEGAIFTEDDRAANISRNTYLGFLLDTIFSDFATIDITSWDTLTVPRNIIERYHPEIVERYPTDLEIPLYNKDTWNWPLPAETTAPTNKEIKSKGGWQEVHLSAFFNAIALAIKPAIKARAKSSESVAERYWLGSYSMRRMPGTADGAGAYNRKPDMILVEKSDPPSDSISWMSPKVIAEYSSQAWKPSTRLQKTLHTKAYLVFLDQPWRRFVLGLSVAKQQMRVHFYDRSGCSISPPFDIHSNPHTLVAILTAVMFGPRQCVGFDPTVNVWPILPLRVSRRKVIYNSTCANVPDSVPEESEDSDEAVAGEFMQPTTLPNYVDVMTQTGIPTFILPAGVNAKPPPTSSAPDQAGISNNPITPIGQIQGEAPWFIVPDASGRCFGAESQSNHVVRHTSLPPDDDFEYSRDEAEENAADLLQTPEESSTMPTADVLDRHQQTNGQPRTPNPAVLTALQDPPMTLVDDGCHAPRHSRCPRE
ncbi:hypothetical protein EDD15DRAFT_2361051 [Pisolithus albus]|nr:hypothetical protein EDD15DRAFT_2361051 [Pisolithus albus]